MMLTATKTKQRWELTAQSFDKLLDSIDADRAAASEKYLQIRKNLIRFFEGRGFFDAETHADEVLNRVTKKIDMGESFENIGSYVYGVARFLVLELRKKNAREEYYLIQQPTSTAPQNEIEQEDASRQLNCLNKCLCQLSEENRQLIIAYYQGEKGEKIANRQRLAERLGIPQNALRSRAVRLREKLESCITSCQKRKN
jgi:RNA polymerase sigma factor (sigma-70 family)